MNTCCIGPGGEDNINSGPCAATIESADQPCLHTIYNCSTKRFANIYRLIKAPLSPEDLVAFEGTAANRGEFRAAMLLLAILTGFPQLSARLFRALEDQQTPSITPQQIFADVRKYLPESSLTAQLQDCLTRLGPTDVSLTRQTYLKWIPRVARFSFYTAEVSEATI